MEFEYIKDYKGYPIYQDMDNGYFVAFDNEDNIVSNEGTLEMVKTHIDNIPL